MNESSVTGNLDNLEAGMDGVVQSIVCAKEVGWAHQARKIILMATDGFLHFAGDGKVPRKSQRANITSRAEQERMKFT